MTETIELGATQRARRLSFVLLVHLPTGATRHPIEGTLLVGKSPDNDVVLEIPGISRYHLELRPEPDRVLVRDVGSKNGTFFDGAQITEARLGAGAILRVGGPAGLEMSIELAEQPALAPSPSDHFGPLIGSSRAMRSLFAVLERTAASNTTMLVIGETGTGKELVAQAIHGASARRDAPLVVVDCGAIPHHLVESELFGHKKGAFTDANSDRSGAFEAAQGGTLFLDEIGELPLELQPKLLRAVESRSIQRIGETARRIVDVRLIAATNRTLEREVAAGRFRQDLFFRLAVVTVALPPLRERGDDVLALARHIMTQLGRADAFDLEGPIAQAMLAYSWPGNVRELRNAIERAIHLGAEHAIPMVPGKSEAKHAPLDPAPDLPFKEAKEQIVGTFERAYLERLLSRHGNNISAAARDAGIDRNYLYRLIKKHALE